MEHLVLKQGANLVLNPEEEASETEGESESTRTRWYSAAIIHYTGHGLWSVGIIPHDHSKWEWFKDIPISSAGELLAGTKFRNCPTEKLLERLRDSQ